jgi:hypothetical protein
MYGDAPDPPDYGPIADASKESAEIAAGVAKEQLAWAKEQYGLDRQVLDQVVSRALAQQDQLSEWAQEDRDRYKQKFQGLEDQYINEATGEAEDRAWRREAYAPLEDRMLEEARSYGTPERMEFEMGRAQADVAAQMESARRSSLSNLESFGINPSSTRYAALDRAVRTSGAAAQAGAGNMARAQTEQTARALEDRALNYKTQQDAIGRAVSAEALNIGKGLPAQAIGAYGQALAAGNSAGANQLAGTASGAQTMGTGAQWMGLQNQALGTWGNALTAGYNAQLAQYNADQNSSSGIGSLLGTGLGLASSFMKLADGGSVTPGGAIPAEASPTGGAAIDDVDAKLTAGEFVIPKDVVTWLGEKGMHQLIEKARKERMAIPMETGAIPDQGVGTMGEPQFVSQAIPTGG